VRDQKYTPGQVAQIKALLAKKFDPEDRSPEAKGHRFLKRLLEYGQASQHSRYATQLALPFAIMTRQETAEHNRKLIQQALDTAPPGTEVNVSALPLLRDDCGETPVAALCSVPRDRTLLLSEALAAGYELTEEDGIKRYRLPNSRARQSSRSRSLDSE
jgi:hypothetical protein